MTTVPVRRHNHVRRLASDRAFDGVLYTIAAILTLTALYPMYFIIIASISDPSLVAQGKILLLPRGVTLEGYEHLASMKNLWVGYGNTILYTIAGTAIMLVVNIPVAYALSRRDLVGRRWFTLFFVFPMFFGGGLIPTYLVVVGLGLVNTRWAMILPGLLSTYNIIMMMTYFRGIPASLEESARIDGANDWVILIKIMIPLALPVIAVIALYIIVANWNSYIPATIYLRDRKLFPLQVILREILISGTSNLDTETSGYDNFSAYSEAVKYATIIASTIPVLCIYPFLQRFFVKGVMLGAIKG